MVFCFSIGVVHVVLQIHRQFYALTFHFQPFAPSEFNESGPIWFSLKFMTLANLTESEQWHKGPRQLSVSLKREGSISHVLVLV